MTVAVFILALPSFFFINLFLHDLYDPNDKLAQPKFGKTAIVLIEQSISVLPLSILLHPIRVMRHTALGLSCRCWDCASSCFIEHSADIQPGVSASQGETLDDM